MKKATLIPNKSVGDISLGDFITNYLNRQYAYHPKGDLYLEDLYTFDTPKADVFVDEDKKITTINCTVECIWKDVDLIKMQFSQFLALANIQPDTEEKIYLLVNNKGQNQTVYTFESLGLQIWVWRNRIVTVSATLY